MELKKGATKKLKHEVAWILRKDTESPVQDVEVKKGKKYKDKEIPDSRVLRI